MLNPVRTEFTPLSPRMVFHFVPNGSAVYTELVDKYGADFVYRGNGATDGAVLTKILGRVVAGGNDVIRLYPGTFVAGAVVTVAKIGVTIEGSSENAAAVTWDCDTTDCAAFSITAAGVTLRNFMIDEPAAGTTDTITSTGVGTILDNLIVQGGNIASTTATINVTGNYTTVRNCRLHLIRKGIVMGGSYSRIEKCIIDGSDATDGNFGAQLTGAASRLGQVIRDCEIQMTGATNPKGTIIAANADAAALIDNVVFAANAAILGPQADTAMVGNRTTYLAAGNQTTPVWIEA